MAQHAKRKAVRQDRLSDASASRNSAPPSDAGAVSRREKSLVRERDQARRALAAAEARIAELERVQDQVVNRIDWVIDSLHNLEQGKS